MIFYNIAIWSTRFVLTDEYIITVGNYRLQ